MQNFTLFLTGARVGLLSGCDEVDVIADSTMSHRRRFDTDAAPLQYMESGPICNDDPDWSVRPGKIAPLEVYKGLYYLKIRSFA